MATKTNVTATKPAINGAVSVAPLGTTLPTDATTALANTYTNLGYISDDGMTETISRETEGKKAWGGDIVDTVQTEHNVTEQCTFIEYTNVDVLKMVFGDTNVSGTLSTGITINCNAKELEHHVFVVDTVLRNNTVQRICIPDGQITNVGEIVYSDSASAGYGVTITCYPNASGNKYYKYIKAATTSNGGTQPQ